jgi:hypothetical protein
LKKKADFKETEVHNLSVVTKYKACFTSD